MALIKSVSGVRGIVRSEHPNRITMDETVAGRLGRAYASYLKERGPRDANLMLVGGRDGRAGGDLLLTAFMEGAGASGVTGLDIGIVTTPGVAMMVKTTGAAGGVVITASHNPAEWNGVKLMTPEGCAPPPGDAAAIFEKFDGNVFSDAPVAVAPMSAPVDPHEHHVETVLKTVDAERIRRCSFSVALDSINGAGAIAGRMLLDRLGCRLTQVNEAPAAVFAHTPEPIAANLGSLCDLVRETGVAIGFAQDPDADRLAIIDERGSFIGEEYTLALCAMRVLATSPGSVAVNLSTSRMIDDVAAAVGGSCRVVRSAVGEANVVQAMKEHGCVIGGEGNGGVIDPRVVYVRDSLAAMALVLDLMAAERQSVSALVNRVPRYAMLKDKVTCDAERIARALHAMRETFADGLLQDIDGVRVDWPEDQKWLHVRGSNTEPIMRIIVEATDDGVARALMSRARDAVALVMN